MKPHHLQTKTLEFTYTGPHIDKGPLPSFFYFALSAHDSLFLSPYNHPVKFLEKYTQDLDIRIFSTTIPGHEEGRAKENAIEWWASQFKMGIDPLDGFIEALCSSIEELYEKEILIKGKIVAGGLSRGALVAGLLSAKQNLVSSMIGFAPLTTLEYAKEFSSLQAEPIINQYTLKRFTPQLSERKIRFYIGNHDTRVKTESAFELIKEIASYAHSHRIKGSHEIFITNSIGYMGHGTSDETFKDGSLWVFEELFYHG